MTSFNDRTLTILLFSVLIKRLGGKVVITQEDIDSVAFNHLNETLTDDGVEFIFREREAAS